MAPSLRIPVTLDLKDFQRGMTEAGNKVHQESEHMQGHFDDVNGTISTLAVGAAALGVAFTTAALGAARSLAKIGDEAEDLRLPINLLQALSVEADRARVPADALTSALHKFTEASKKGGEDAEKLHKALENVGGGFREAFENAKTQKERLDVVSNALKSTTDEVKRAQLALQVFGTDNERLIGVLGSGAAAFDRYVENAARLGLAINENLVKAAQDAQSQIQLLTRILSDKFSVAAADLIPILLKLLPAFQAIAVAANAMSAIFANDDTASVQTLKNELDGLIDAWVRLKLQRDKIAERKRAPLDDTRDSIRDFLGISADANEDLKALDEDLKKVETRIETIKKLIQSKGATPPAEAPAFKPRPPLKEKGDEFDTQVDSINRHIAALAADAIAVGQTKAAHATLRAELSLLQAAERAGNEVTVEQIDKYTQLRATMSAKQALDGAGITLNTEHAASFEQVTQRVGAMTQKLDDVNRAFKGANDSAAFFGNQAVDIISGLANGAKGIDLLRSSLQALTKELLRAAFTGQGAFAQILGFASQTGGTGGIAGLFAGIGRNAQGTDNWRGGMSWVGEDGPELVDLPKGARVIPNRAIRSGGLGSSIAVTNVIDARNVDPGIESRIMARLPGVVHAATMQAVAAVPQARRNNPGYLG